MTMAAIIALIALAAVSAFCIGWLVGADAQYKEDRRKRK